MATGRSGEQGRRECDTCREESRDTHRTCLNKRKAIARLDRLSTRIVTRGKGKPRGLRFLSILQDSDTFRSSQSLLDTHSKMHSKITKDVCRNVVSRGRDGGERMVSTGITWLYYRSLVSTGWYSTSALYPVQIDPSRAISRMPRDRTRRGGAASLVEALAGHRKGLGNVARKPHAIIRSATSCRGRSFTGGGVSSVRERILVNGRDPRNGSITAVFEANFWSAEKITVQVRSRAYNRTSELAG